LQQVFQNLVQNAAEAVRAGESRGHVRVSCALEPADDGGESLTVRFADDGVGISSEDLPRIFEKGFSTKPRDTNHGIGLHWCANALRALGGTIHAEGGADGGAIFSVTVPVLRPAAVAVAA
jgi:signal transduction histidine kinase